MESEAKTGSDEHLKGADEQETSRAIVLQDVAVDNLLIRKSIHLTDGAGKQRVMLTVDDAGSGCAVLRSAGGDTISLAFDGNGWPLVKLNRCDREELFLGSGGLAISTKNEKLALTTKELAYLAKLGNAGLCVLPFVRRPGIVRRSLRWALATLGRSLRWAADAVGGAQLPDHAG